MAIQLNSYKHTFDIELTPIGKLEIKTEYPFDKLGEDIEGDDEYEFVRELIQKTGKIINKDMESPSSDLTYSLVKRLDENELEKFASSFIKENGWLFFDHENPKRKTRKSENGGEIFFEYYDKCDIPRLPNESHCQYLFKLYKRYLDLRQKKWEKATSKMFSMKTWDLLNNNIKTSNALGRTISNIPVITGSSSPLRNDLNHIKSILKSSAALIKSLNDTCINILKDQAANHKSTSRYNRTLIFIGLITLFFTAAINVLNVCESRRLNKNFKFFLEQNNVLVTDNNSLTNTKFINDSISIDTTSSKQIDSTSINKMK